VADEPEAALSPQRQLRFREVIHDLEACGRAQFLISTHSPIILSCPGAVLLSLNGVEIRRIEYRDIERYRLSLDFLACPERYFEHLFAPSGADTDPQDAPGSE
jgi:predicted ATPase